MDALFKALFAPTHKMLLAIWSCRVTDESPLGYDKPQYRITPNNSVARRLESGNRRTSWLKRREEEGKFAQNF